MYFEKDLLQLCRPENTTYTVPAVGRLFLTGQLKVHRYIHITTSDRDFDKYNEEIWHSCDIMT